MLAESGNHVHYHARLVSPSFLRLSGFAVVESIGETFSVPTDHTTLISLVVR